MAQAPGKSNREGISLIEMMNMFPTEDAAIKWFDQCRWPDGERYCPHCGSVSVAVIVSGKPMPFRCRDCRNHFSVRSGTAMERSKIPLRKWAVAIYLTLTSLKSVSSMKLHRDLRITQKSAWFMLHRLRQAWDNQTDDEPFAGPVEVDETYMGGKRKNMPKAKRKTLTGRGSVGKTAVVGAKDRATKRVRAKVVQNTDKATLQGFVADTAAPGAQVYTDEHASYEGMPFPHEAVKHSVAEYVRGQAHTNGVESFWSMLQRAHDGTFHKISPKHLNRYVQEFAGKHNVRDQNTIDQMQDTVARLVGSRLLYTDLTAKNGLASGARN